MPPESEPILELDSFLPYRLSVLSNTVSDAIASLYSERFHLTSPEWRVMAVLGRYPGLSAAEVAQRTAMDKVAVSRAVARLVKAGRVTRDTAATDRRRSELSLSAAGHDVYRRVVPMARQFERKLLAALTASEREDLSLLLYKLEQRADDLNG